MISKPKYVTNKELLREIHLSKISFCVFEEPRYADFDAIVGSVAAINAEVIERATARRIKLFAKTNPGLVVLPEDLVFRVMTYEHIPIDPTRKRKARNTDVPYARTSFPPFKHYVLRDGQPVEVGRSHWRGTIEEGEFATDTGKISRRLAEMWMMLVDRYSRRGNWRGYCVDTETEAFTQRGWLRHDQINESDTILSYDQGKLKWSSIASIFRDTYDGNMFRMTVSGMDALVTPGHKFVTQDGLKRAEYLLETDKIILTGEAVAGPEQATYDDAFVELVGWVVTEGNFHQDRSRNYPRVTIYQHEGASADRIRDCGSRLGMVFSEHGKKKNIAFHLRKALCEQVAGVVEINGKVLKMEFLLALTQPQRGMLIETMIDADGHRNVQGRKPLLRYSQKSRAHVDAFVALCTLAGLRASVKERAIVSYGKPTTIHQVTIFSERTNHSRVENIDFHGGKRNGKIKGRGKINHPNEPTVPYHGIVWCPKTEYGSFMARRNGTIYLTGNTYIDEMRSFALMQLSQVGLQFDESKSDNPFAFYTTTVRNCFTRILLVEKKSQSIRDDMLIMAGVAPSYTRQVEAEMEQKFPTEAVKKKPGRKPKQDTPNDPTA